MALPGHWMAAVLRSAGCNVVELAGSQTRGQPGVFAPVAVMWHHDGSAPGDSPSLPASMANLNNNGSQLWVDRYGTWYVIACGLMYHAGAGAGFGNVRANQGNRDSIGVETDHTIGEAWPVAQLRSLRAGTQALLARLGQSADRALCAHKEYAAGRKPDPDGLYMPHERVIVGGDRIIIKENEVGFEQLIPVAAGVPGYAPGAELRADTMLSEAHAFTKWTFDRVDTVEITQADLVARITRLEARPAVPAVDIPALVAGLAPHLVALGLVDTDELAEELATDLAARLAA